MKTTKVRYTEIGRLIGKTRQYVWGAVNGKFTPNLRMARKIVKASNGTIKLVELVPDLKAVFKEML